MTNATKEQLLALASSDRVPLRCRLGFHQVVTLEMYITSGYSACARCGRCFGHGLFGGTTFSRAESVNILRRLRARAHSQEVK